MAAGRPARLAAAGLPALAVAVLALGVAATLVSASAAGTLGFDFLAYHAAAQRVLEGRPLYDLTFQSAGPFGLFYYPPTFVIGLLPFGLLPAAAATWIWTVLLVAGFLVAVAILPVAPRVRWLVILLAALDWPFLYALKLGQVGPMIFLAFAVGWRWLERPVVLGLSAAIGAAVKIQPGLVLAWALASRRWRAVAIGIGALAVLAIAATLLAGPGAWGDYWTLLTRVAEPVTTEHNFTPGAVAYGLGASRGAATAVQYASWVLVVVLVLLGIRESTPEASYLSVVIASQLLSPVLWDHYAVMLLLPVAWLLDRGQWWAVAIPLATAVPLIGVTPPAAYPLLFAVALVAVLVVGRRRPAGSPQARVAAVSA